ncbi:MAG TPA: tripartite tricarboxylate transporter substrate binding protein [Pseudolabrys sp.]|nr:tripartite tricarboxylate transporter substrate binding protein [Pseudolabrys sp.]
MLFVKSPARLGAIGLVVLSALIAAAPAHAEDWPTRPIRVISPYPAGSASDTVTRVVVEQASQIAGKPFVVEIRTGAGGSVGFGVVAKAAADGYMVATSSSSMATESVLHRKLPYDPVRDFIHVALLGTSPNILVASKASGFKTVADLVAAAKAKPGTLTFASAGIGSSSHMAAERFRLAAKIDVRHVPFREGGLLEVMAGRIDFYFIPLAAAASALHNDKLTVLAVSAPKRVDVIPNVPSVTEAGYPGAVFRFWNGLSVPAGTPKDVVQKMHDVVQKALDTPEVQAKLAKLGVELAHLSVEEFGKFFRDDYEATRQLAKDAGIQPLD